MHSINPCQLSGRFVSLEPLDPSHANELRHIAQDESISYYFPTSIAGEYFDPWLNKTLQGMQNGTQLAFVVRRKFDSRIVGSTRYYDIAPEHRRLMIGYTWYIKEARGTAVNPECKFLLLQHAFEVLGINRVELVTDSRNLPSRAAIKKLGATEEGILRQHMILANGYIRDTVLFSILQSEWPTIKENLSLRLT